MTSQARLLLVLVALLAAFGVAGMWYVDESQLPPARELERESSELLGENVERGKRGERAAREAQVVVVAPTPGESESARVAGRHAQSSEELVIQGRVLNSAGEPISGARVHVRENEVPQPVSQDFDPFQETCETSSLGEFKLRVDHQGQYAVMAQLGEKRSNEFVLVDLGPSHPAETVELTIAEPRMIEGLVLHQNQRPAPRAHVFAYVDVEREGIELPSGFDSVELFGQSTVLADQDGAFRFEFAADDRARYTVRAEMPRVHAPARGERYLIQGQRWSGEARGVQPGTAPLTLVLGPPPPYPPSIRLVFHSEDGGQLPTSLRYRLQRLGPHGGVYQERVISRATLPGGELVIENVIGGARYRVRLDESGLSLPFTVGPFFAEEGETLQKVVLPGLFDGTFRFEDPQGRLAQGFVLLLLFIDESGGRHRISEHRYDKSFPEITLPLPAGDLHAEVLGVVSGRSSGGEPFLTRKIEMRTQATVFDIAVP